MAARTDARRFAPRVRRFGVLGQNCPGYPGELRVKRHILRGTWRGTSLLREVVGGKCVVCFDLRQQAAGINFQARAPSTLLVSSRDLAECRIAVQKTALAHDCIGEQQFAVRADNRARLSKNAAYRGAVEGKDYQCLGDSITHGKNRCVSQSRTRGGESAIGGASEVTAGTISGTLVGQSTSCNWRCCLYLGFLVR